MQLFNQTHLVASFWPSTDFSSCSCSRDAADCKLLWLSMWRSETHLCPTSTFKGFDLESWALQIAPKWNSVIFTFAGAFSCSENLSFQIIMVLSDDFIEFISLGKWFWKITFSDMTRDCDRKQWAKQPQRRINIIMHLRWRLLKSGIDTRAIYGYTRGTTQNRAKLVFLI